MIASYSYRAKTSKTIFVGIGQIGNFHVLRRRDFILPSVANGDTAGKLVNYGQIENFYRFLTKEIAPLINLTYHTNNANNTIAGHLLGGLFAFYCLFKNENVFKNYYALSPALWIDHYSIYDFNKLNTGLASPKYLYFSGGGMEIMNHIKKGTTNMDSFLKAANYPGLNYTYQIHQGKTHNSQVEYSLKELLK